jgi:hypothetical protein
MSLCGDVLPKLSPCPRQAPPHICRARRRPATAICAGERCSSADAPSGRHGIRCDVFAWRDPLLWTVTIASGSADEQVCNVDSVGHSTVAGQIVYWGRLVRRTNSIPTHERSQTSRERAEVARLRRAHPALCLEHVDNVPVDGDEDVLFHQIPCRHARLERRAGEDDETVRDDSRMEVVLVANRLQSRTALGFNPEGC